MRIGSKGGTDLSIACKVNQTDLAPTESRKQCFQELSRKIDSPRLPVHCAEHALGDIHDQYEIYSFDLFLRGNRSPVRVRNSKYNKHNSCNEEWKTSPVHTGTASRHV